MDGGPTNLKSLLKEHPPGPGSALQSILGTDYSIVNQMAIICGSIAAIWIVTAGMHVYPQKIFF